MQATEIMMTVKRGRHRSSESAESAKGRQRSEAVTGLGGLGRVRRGPVEFSLVSPGRAGRIGGVLTCPGRSSPERRSPNQSILATTVKRPFSKLSPVPVAPDL